MMVGGDEDCGAGIGGEGGGPLYMTGGLKGGSSVMKRQRASSFFQGYGSSSSLSSDRVGQQKSLKSPMSTKRLAT